MKRSLIILTVLIGVMAGCERRIPYNGEYQDARLVFESYLCAGEDSFYCYIDRSYFFLESKPYQPTPLEGVTLSLYSYANGDLPIVSDSADGCLHKFKLAKPLTPGDTVRMTVSHPDFGTSSAEEALMPAFETEVKSAVWQRSQEYADNYCRMTLALPEYPYTAVTMSGCCYITYTTIRPHFENDSDTYIVTGNDTIERTIRQTIIYSKDRVFDLMGNNYSKTDEAYESRELMFMTDYRQGKEVEVWFKIGIPYDNTRTTTRPNGEELVYYNTYRLDSCEFTFETFSENYYMYLKSMEAYLGVNQDYSEADLGAVVSDMFGTEERAAIYSNVVDGFGILMSETRSRVVIRDFAIQ